MILEEATAELLEVLRGGDEAVNVWPSIDAVSPPCLLVLWAETYLEPATVCRAWLRPAVCCVAGRIDAPAGKAMLDALVEFVLARCRHRYPWERVTAPGAMAIAGVEYLTQRVILRQTITLPDVAPWPGPSGRILEEVSP